MVGAGSASRFRLLISGVGWQTAAQVVPLLLNVLLTPFLLHGFGTARYGLFLLVSTLSLLLGAFDGGVGQSSMRFFTLYAGAGDRRAATTLLTTLVALLGGIGIVALSVVVLLKDDLLAFFGVSPDLLSECSFLLATSAGIVVCLLVRQPFQGLLLANNRYRVNSSPVLIGHVIWAVGSVLSVVKGWNLYGIAATLILQQTVSTSIILPPCRRYLDRAGVGWLPRAELAEFFRYAWKVQVSGLVNLLAWQKDSIVAGRLLGAENSTPFGQGVSFSQQVRLLPMNAVAPIQTLIGQLVGAVGPTRAVADFVKVQRMWVISVTGLCAVAAPAAFFAVRAWVPQIPIAGDVAAILIAGQLGFLLPAVLIIWGLTLGHPELDLRFSLQALGVSLALTAVLVPFLGPIGSVLATAIGNVVSCLLISRVAGRVLPFPVPSFFRDIPIGPGILAATVTVLIELLLRESLPHGALGLLCGALVGLPGLLAYALTTLGPHLVGRMIKERSLWLP